MVKRLGTKVMADILRIGSSALLNIQHAMSTTGHNIANVNTEGYSRQSVNVIANDYQGMGFGFLGQGSRIQSITRSTNEFLTAQIQQFSSSQSHYETGLTYLARLDDIMSNTSNNLNTALQNFFNSVQEVAANPSGVPERQLLISDAQNLVNRQQSMNRMFTDLNKEVNSEIRSIVSEVNGLADSISLLNREIVSARSGNNNAPPNDLLDKRDLLIKQLSAKVSVTAVDQSDGSLNIFVGRGQALVVGAQVTHLQAQNNPYDSSRTEIGVAGNPLASNISAHLTGGELQGLLDFRNNSLAPAQQQTGLITIALTDAFNAQHRRGMDLNGEMGGNFFTPVTPLVAGHINNAGSAAPAVTITNPGALTPNEYRLGYDGTTWSLTRLSDNVAVTGAGPLVMDGMSVSVTTGTPTAGDTFLLNPGRDASNNFALTLRDARKIAAAGAISLNTTPANLGSGAIQNVQVTNAAVMPLPIPLNISFDPNALGAGVPGLLINGGANGTLAYNPATESGGKDFVLAGLGVGFRMTGVPQNGDSFRLGNNSGARGDNGNALSLGLLQQQNLVDGSRNTFQQYYSTLVADVGVDTRQMNANLQVENSLLEQAVSYRDGISGVNLDEEASEMLRLQQAYQASAQIVKVADELFQILVDSVRR
jgi:flagellar hook-associated protein 1 FlgK